MRTFAVIVFLFAQVGAAHSETYYTDIGGRTVNLQVPDDYCVLTGADESENMLLEFLAAANAGVNTLHIAFAECTQLQEWKQGARENLDSFGYMLSPSRPGLAEFPGDQGVLNSGLEPTLSQMGDSEFGQMLGAGTGQAQAALDKLELGVQIQQTIPLGYFGYDDYGSYVGLIQKLSTAQGTQKTMLGMYSTMVVHNRLLFFYLWDAYSGDVGEVDELLELTREYSSWQHEVN
jgi:hypothetical protein